jgi:hypothetical protein
MQTPCSSSTGPVHRPTAHAGINALLTALPTGAAHSDRVGSRLLAEGCLNHAGPGYPVRTSASASLTLSPHEPPAAAWPVTAVRLLLTGAVHAAVQHGDPQLGRL